MSVIVGVRRAFHHTASSDTPMQETLVDVATNVASQEKEARSLRSNCWTGLTDSIKSNSRSLSGTGERRGVRSMVPGGGVGGENFLQRVHGNVSGRGEGRARVWCFHVNVCVGRAKCVCVCVFPGVAWCHNVCPSVSRCVKVCLGVSLCFPVFSCFPGVFMCSLVFISVSVLNFLKIKRVMRERV